MLYLIEKEKANLEKEVVMNTDANNVFSALRSRALADDQRFVMLYLATGRVNKEQLAAWLTAFNRWLQFKAEPVNGERDYRRRFAAWFRLRNPFTERPDDYDPGAETTTTQAPAKLVPLPVYQPTLPGIEDTPGDDPEYKKVLGIDTHGKFSKKDNKYDMHWLKSLRDEVRKMGG